jgi:hypothetical protein
MIDLGLLLVDHLALRVRSSGTRRQGHPDAAAQRAQGETGEATGARSRAKAKKAQDEAQLISARKDLQRVFVLAGQAAAEVISLRRLKIEDDVHCLAVQAAHRRRI